MDPTQIEFVVSRVSDLLQQSALQSENFEDSFREVADLIGARSFHLSEMDGTGAQRFLIHESGMAMLDAYYSGGWHEIDTWTERSLRPALKGEIVLDRMVIPEADASRDPFFQDYCADWGVRHFSAFSWKTENQLLGATVIRPTDRPFTQDDAIVLKLIRPSVVGAVLVASTLRNTRIKGLASGLELSGRPCLILDQRGRVMFMTPGASSLNGQAFHVSGGNLRGLDLQTDANLRKVEGWLLGRRPHPPAAFRMSSPSLPGPLFAFTIPVRQFAYAELPGAAALLVLMDPSRRSQVNPQHLMAIWDLTPREAELAGLFAGGSTLEQAAEAMALKVSTIRQMHKSILAKAGVSRQSELAVLLSRIAGPFTRPGPGEA